MNFMKLTFVGTKVQFYANISTIRKIVSFSVGETQVYYNGIEGYDDYDVVIETPEEIIHMINVRG